MRGFMKRYLQKAVKASKKAYAPYSKFCVGAVVVTDSGKIFDGCNIENSSYGLTICAERMAIFKAVSEGFKKIKAVYIYANAPEPVAPCGACRQVMAEFGDSDTVIVSYNGKAVKTWKLGELLPEAFKL